MMNIMNNQSVPSISMNKQYTYHKGGVARVLCIDGPDIQYPVITVTTCGKVISHTKTGQYTSVTFGSVYDLIEVSPYKNFKIDDKVIVWDGSSDLEDQDIRINKRHFAGISSGGRPLAFVGGRTSYTAIKGIVSISWDNCILANDMEGN